VVDTDLMPYEAFQDALRLNAGHLRRRFLETNHLVEDAILELRRLGVEAQREPEPEEDDYFDRKPLPPSSPGKGIRPRTLASRRETGRVPAAVARNTSAAAAGDLGQRTYGHGGDHPGSGN